MFRDLPPLSRQQVDALLLAHRGNGDAVPGALVDGLVKLGLLDRTVRDTVALTDRGLLWLMTQGYLRRPRASG